MSSTDRQITYTIVFSDLLENSANLLTRKRIDGQSALINNALYSCILFRIFNLVDNEIQCAKIKIKFLAKRQQPRIIEIYQDICVINNNLHTYIRLRVSRTSLTDLSKRAAALEYEITSLASAQ